MNRLLYTGINPAGKEKDLYLVSPLRWRCTATKSSLTPTGTGSREQRLVRGNWEVGHRTAFLPRRLVIKANDNQSFVFFFMFLCQISVPDDLKHLCRICAKQVPVIRIESRHVIQTER